MNRALRHDTCWSRLNEEFSKLGETHNEYECVQAKMSQHQSQILLECEWFLVWNGRDCICLTLGIRHNTLCRRLKGVTQNRYLFLVPCVCLHFCSDNPRFCIAKSALEQGPLAILPCKSWFDLICPSHWNGINSSRTQVRSTRGHFPCRFLSDF